MSENISDSIILITGASSGIGRATALAIARKHGTVVLASRQEKALREVAEECERMGGRALVVTADVTDESQVQALAHQAIETYGRINVWVNNAGVALYSKFEESPPDAFRRVIETNLFGCVHGARAALPHFRKQGRGVLINISSAFGKSGAPYVTAYATSKFAINGFSESLRMELQNDPHIHVCTVLPATMDTPIFQHAANFTGRFVEALPPVYKPEQVAEAILGCIVNPKREVLVGRSARHLVLLRKFSTELSERLVAAKVERKHFLDKPVAHSQGNLFAPMPEYNSVHGGWLDTDHKARNIITAAAAVFLAGAGFAFYKYRKQKHSSIAEVRDRLTKATA
ncbi:SDR family oxidoreductase [Pedosphaera parvula]|uniref:Short-chain dehydrogenase/reductase SDR n=1 Tax=Pedosphaera parvula (strain Ellin514) TaxID=320771 RepID=B9XNC1_PEDPL|nr:SDR family oxidoreductase [Pedosphaera parvula]EEF58674.1 short-chain dehydrogenase/reductase SDR [Pedosphaera parvula Ellin514]